jgi:hypothetical protein
MPGDIPEFFDPAEDCPWCSPREILARHGYAPLPPGELDDRQLSGRLWELLYAAAACRFFFSSTDHLDDRSLYTLLWEEWLDEPTADIPPEAETNTNLIIAEFDARGMTADEIWLRYYADEDDNALWLSTDPNFVFPPHEDPPFDRDRFLPTAPIPLATDAGWLSEDDDPAEENPATENENDPLGLGAVDREIAAAKEGSAPDAPKADDPDSAPDERLHAVEPDNWRPPAQQLAEQNIPLLPPAEITDETLVPILWELLHNLSLRGFYVQHSDHLNDRELYAELWERGLRDPAHLPGRNPRGGWFYDILGGGDDDEIQLWLRYYATDDERAKHAKEYPDDTIPRKEMPCGNRDWRLPKGPF